MGFKLSINTILRQDIENFVVVKEYPFTKDSLVVLADEIPIWLTKKDWTALAEISITTQSRRDGQTVGNYRVEYVYEGKEQATLTKIFRRMYGWS